MKIALIALAGAATVLTAVPAEARHWQHRNSAMVCSKVRHGRCVAMHRMNDRAMARHMARRAAAHRVGYRFAPSYGYTAYDALPQPYVTRYHLAPDNRYVYNNGYIYVVDPKTYAVQQVISALTH